MMEEILQNPSSTTTITNITTTLTNSILPPRHLSSWYTWTFNLTKNTTETFQDATEHLSENLQPASDVDIEGVRATIYFNALVFVVLALLYEGLRKFFPSVYASRQTRRRGGGGGESSRVSVVDVDVVDQFEDDVGGGAGKSASFDVFNLLNLFCWNSKTNGNGDDAVKGTNGTTSGSDDGGGKGTTDHDHRGGPQDLYKDTGPFQWILPIMGVSWRRIHKIAGLDSYFFLRYIRMCYRITSVTAIWGMLLLFPVYYTGTNGAGSWYHFSMANVNQGDTWRIWVPTLFMYIFSGFVFYVMKNELAHFMELRLDYLGKGELGVNPQQHYSIMLENVPKELRSDRALYEYFDQLFPGKVHSANVLLYLPELELLSQKKDRTVRRLEKSIARYEATGERSMHLHGRPRLNCCDIDLSHLSCLDCCCNTTVPHDMDTDGPVSKGKLVDSINYYTFELNALNREFSVLQREKMAISEASNRSLDSNAWFNTVSRIADIFLDEKDDDDYTIDTDTASEYTNYNTTNEPHHRIDPRELGLSLSSSVGGSHYPSLAYDLGRKTPLVGKKRRGVGIKREVSWDLSDRSFGDLNGQTSDITREILSSSLSEEALSGEANHQISASDDTIMEGVSAGLSEEPISGEMSSSPTGHTHAGGTTTTTPPGGDQMLEINTVGTETTWTSCTECIDEQLSVNEASNELTLEHATEEQPTVLGGGGVGSGLTSPNSGELVEAKDRGGIETWYSAEDAGNTDHEDGGEAEADADGDNDGVGDDNNDCEADSICANKSKETIETKSVSSCSMNSSQRLIGGYGSLDLQKKAPYNKKSSKSVKWSLRRNKSEGDAGSDSSQQSKTQPLLGEEYVGDDLLRKQGSNDSSSIKSKPQRKTKHSTMGRIGARLGIDFLMYGVKQLNKKVAKRFNTDDASGRMSSTGFVTFFDLASVTYAAGVSLSHCPYSLDVTVAPEARDLVWSNANLSTVKNKRRETTANILLTLGVFFWSIPLALIQALASADKVAQIPGMAWILTFADGKMKTLVNAYLPVVLLLTMILLLPHIFKWVAVTYEKRKTKSDIDQSVVGRYFYYQLANIFITVTAGSIWKSAADIMSHPTYFLEILGNSLPTVVGYFIALLVTKILSGLPMIMLRIGALCRYVLLRIVHRKKYLTQRELDQIYRVESLWYAWEYPNQMMVIVICFTYACISPVILIFGAFFFWISLMVYKKQVLCVFTPQYESGGKLFPFVIDRTILGLICGQLTFIGYSTIRGAGVYQMMWHFRAKYAEPSRNLTLERAIELDGKLGTFTAAPKSGEPPLVSLRTNRNPPQLSFCSDYYKQPALTQCPGEPLPYRSSQEDHMTVEAIKRLAESRAHMWSRKGVINNERIEYPWSQTSSRVGSGNMV